MGRKHGKQKARQLRDKTEAGGKERRTAATPVFFLFLCGGESVRACVSGDGLNTGVWRSESAAALRRSAASRVQVEVGAAVDFLDAAQPAALERDGVDEVLCARARARGGAPVSRWLGAGSGASSWAHHDVSAYGLHLFGAGACGGGDHGRGGVLVRRRGGRRFFVMRDVERCRVVEEGGLARRTGRVSPIGDRGEGG